MPVVVEQGQDHQGQTHGQPVDLLDVKGRALAPVIPGAVKVHQTHGGDDEHQRQEQVIKVLD